jgi:hypothetical protein
MGEQIRDKISSADCIAYAEACDLWAVRAPNDAARHRLFEMGRSWRELQRHLQASEAADKRGSDGKSRAGKAKKPARTGESRNRQARSDS